MRVRLFLTAVFGCCVVFLASVAAGAATPGSAPKLTHALLSPYLSLNRTAALAVSLQNGQVVYAHNEWTPVLPASNEKLPVAWSALMRLGPRYRFHTDVFGVGELRGASWNGDLVLKGFGDPTLTAADLDALARRVRAIGIRRVTGRILGDESYFDARRGAPGWKSYFIGGESPPLSALVVDRAQGWPALSPPLLAARTFRAALRQHGVVITGRPGLGSAPQGATDPIVRDMSAPLAAIVRHMNHESDNFYAEMLLKELGAVANGVGTSAGGSAVVLSTMAAAGIPVDGVRIFDGSGLSSLDRLTAASLVGVLRAGYTTPEIRAAFVESLAVAAQSGTLSSRLSTLRGVIRGKTGTTDLACTLSGFVGKEFVFAVLENGDPVSAWAARAAQDRFVTILARTSLEPAQTQVQGG